MSRLPSPVRPLYKPVPGNLLGQSTLTLSVYQKASILALQKAWEADRAKLMEAMSGFEPKRGRADQISGSLADYSQLSRTYDGSRRAYWTKALGVLEPRQRSLVEGATN